MRTGITLLSTLLVTFFVTDVASAQFRGDIPSPYERTGTITHPADDENATNVMGLFDMSMSQSYEMTFGSFGGNAYNQNILTNTMFLDFSDNLHGRVDVSMSHSPFGSNPMGQQDDFNFFIRNAELQYDISENSTIRFQYSQQPAGYYNRSPFGHSPYGRDFYR